MQRSTVLVHLPGGGSIEIRLERGTEVPLHLQLFEQIKHFVGTKRLPQGAELPSVRRLSRDLGVSTVTVGRAVEALRDRGLVETVAGKGVYVVDFARQLDSRSGEERVRDFSAMVVRQAVVLGLDPARVARAVQELVHTGSDRRDPHRIVVIDEYDSVDVAVEGLRHSLAGDGFDVVGLRLAEVAEAIDVIDGAGTIISAPHCYGLVRRHMAARAGDVVGLTLGLDPEVTAELRSLAASTRVALVATVPAFLGWMTYTVTSQTLLDAAPIGVSMTNRQAVVETLARVDVAVYGSGCRRELPGLLPEGVRGIELRHVVDGESLDALRVRLKGLTAASERGGR